MPAQRAPDPFTFAFAALVSLAPDGGEGTPNSYPDRIWIFNLSLAGVIIPMSESPSVEQTEQAVPG